MKKDEEGAWYLDDETIAKLSDEGYIFDSYIVHLESGAQMHLSATGRYYLPINEEYCPLTVFRDSSGRISLSGSSPEYGCAAFAYDEEGWRRGSIWIMPAE